MGERESRYRQINTDGVHLPDLPENKWEKCDTGVLLPWTRHDVAEIERGHVSLFVASDICPVASGKRNGFESV
jgi:hypothetical protein